MARQQIEMIEANLRRLSVRLPQMPMDAILLVRLIQFLAHDLATVLDHHTRLHGLGEAEFRVLAALFSQPDQAAHPSELCPRTLQSPANMSRISDALVERALITREMSDQDRRRMVLRITAKGEELVQRLMPALYPPFREIFKEFSDAEQKIMIAQLKRLVVQLDDVLAAGVGEAGG